MNSIEQDFLKVILKKDFTISGIDLSKLATELAGRVERFVAWSVKVDTECFGFYCIDSDLIFNTIPDLYDYWLTNIDGK